MLCIHIYVYSYTLYTYYRRIICKYRIDNKYQLVIYVTLYIFISFSLYRSIVYNNIAISNAEGRSSSLISVVQSLPWLINK